MSRLGTTPSRVARWWRDLAPRSRLTFGLLPVVIVIVLVSPNQWGVAAFGVLLVGGQVLGGLANRKEFRVAAARRAEDGDV